LFSLIIRFSGIGFGLFSSCSTKNLVFTNFYLLFPYKNSKNNATPDFLQGWQVFYLAVRSILLSEKIYAVKIDLNNAERYLKNPRIALNTALRAVTKKSAMLR
jgi:hypothetical protein